MKLLLDENLEVSFVDHIPDHEVTHLHSCGWDGIKNGELLDKIEKRGFHALISADKKMRFQQNFKGRSFSLIVLDIHPKKLSTQVDCVPAILHLLPTIEPGMTYIIRGPHSKKNRA